MKYLDRKIVQHLNETLIEWGEKKSVHIVQVWKFTYLAYNLLESQKVFKASVWKKLYF